MRAVVVCSGGLGDFVLALPLLAALRDAGTRVCLVSRASYLELVRGDGLADARLDVDRVRLWDPVPALRAELEGASVLTTLPDRDGTLERGLRTGGARRVVRLCSRPGAPPHVSMRMLRDAGLEPPADLLERSVLGRTPEPDGGRLFVHAGSGSPAKNAPPERLLERARALTVGPGSRPVLLFGPADHALVEPVTRAFAKVGCERWVEPTLTELRARLATEASAFLGNDSGVTHLAAALGVPTTALYVRTDPAIWRPVGRAVRVARLESHATTSCSGSGSRPGAATSSLGAEGRLKKGALGCRIGDPEADW